MSSEVLKRLKHLRKRYEDRITQKQELVAH